MKKILQNGYLLCVTNQEKIAKSSNEQLFKNRSLLCINKAFPTAILLISSESQQFNRLRLYGVLCTVAIYGRVLFLTRGLESVSDVEKIMKKLDIKYDNHYNVF